MPTLLIMCGVAFSGKSTLARAIADATNSDLVAFDELWVAKDRAREQANRISHERHEVEPENVQAVEEQL